MVVTSGAARGGKERSAKTRPGCVWGIVQEEDWSNEQDLNEERQAVKSRVLEGWMAKDKCSDAFKGFWNVQDEFSAEYGLIMKRDRFVAPKKVRSRPEAELVNSVETEVVMEFLKELFEREALPNSS
ncbi:hypothetical protein NDU88_001472 [Pleurodeles waltl]|uniref:Uncharacterized protein n=1 Tax=Pleurodeles waltl TaxID=8319 RepID=A0AAV7USV3_PLEWA|nr:hypothetical protein NDU88_001472 [Pleurodeles waltl]